MKPKHQLVCAGALWAMLSGVHAQESDASDWIKNPAMGNYQAYAEFKMAHYESARHIWQVLAGLGNTDALFNLAILAEDGLGEPRDLTKAESLYTAAAQAGGFKAQYRLGMLYSTGGTLAKDVSKARHFLSLAAAHGDKDAAERLAALDQPQRAPTELEQADILSSSGQQAQAAALFRRAADAGNSRARTRLAWMHEAGRGVERSLEEAARLFEHSAEDGDAEAQYALAVMYRTGKGQTRDLGKSLVWLKRSASQSYPPAQAALAAESALQ